MLCVCVWAWMGLSLGVLLIDADHKVSFYPSLAVVDL